MVLNASHVMFLLLQKYSDPVPINPSIQRDSRRIQRDSKFENEEDGDWEVDDFQPYDDVVLSSHEEIKFGDRTIARDQVQEAIDYYRQTAKGSRPLSSMTSRFRWITTEENFRKMRQFEKENCEFREARTSMLKVLGNRLFDVVKNKLEKGVSLHDNCLIAIAQDINRRETKVERFVASQSWISRWKKSHRIVSRKITKFVTRKCLINKEAIEKTAKEYVNKSESNRETTTVTFNFVQLARREMSLFTPSMIFNADQTGIQKELYSARALAFLGEKAVDRLIQSKSSLTHSFTFLPMLFMNGTLGPKAYMVLSKPTGQFPPTRPIPVVPNLVVRCGKSHIMTKEMMKDWLRTCVFVPEVSKHLYMMVDCWSSFKDHAAIRRCAPPGVDLTIKNIPPHTTGMIQPLDVYWNGPWKNLLKKFTSYVLNFYPDFLIAQRNNEILMIALLFHQISAKIFEDFLKYSRKKSGYTDFYSPFISPSDFCFGDLVNKDCCANGCQEPVFIRCARCKNYICFIHFIKSFQHFCNYR